jgi:UDP-glucose 4-epimerase
MKVVVTGVAGLLGSHIADRLIDSGNQVIGIDNLMGGYLDNVNKEVDFFQEDTSDFKAMENILKDTDVVFHAACTAYEGLSVFSPGFVTQNTFGNSIPLFSAAISQRVKKIVFCSSMARYGSQELIPFQEDSFPHPQDPYGIAKLASEKVLSELCNTHGIEYSIAVPHNIIGPRQKYDDPYRNVASIMINLMLQGRQPIIYGDGSQVRCFSFVEDVIDPLMKMCDLDSASGEIINVGPDEGSVTILELAETIANKLSFNLEPLFLPDRPREVKFATCSADKARRLLGYETTKTLSEGLDSMIEYISTRGTRKFDYHLPLEIITESTPKSWSGKLF